MGSQILPKSEWKDMDTWNFSIGPLAVEDGGIPLENLFESELFDRETVDKVAMNFATSYPEVFEGGKQLGYVILGCVPPGMEQGEPIADIRIIEGSNGNG